jgi:AcrR family transcriptional regulator
VAAVAKPVKSRRYDNAARQAQSEETRQHILDAALDIIVGRGYGATTIAAIARNAGVHIDTVYELVGRKPVLLRELIEQAISGTESAVLAEERNYVKAIRAEPNPARKLAIYARAVHQIQARMAPLFLALRDASATEPEAKQVWRQISDRRARNMHKLAGDLEAAGGIRPGLTIDEAADVIWATNSSELYVLLTVERSWTPDRYERWLADTWCRLLLPDSTEPATRTRPRNKTATTRTRHR